MAKTGIIVIDPGHGGKFEIGGSSANNAISASGVLEKNITLRMAFMVREQLALIAAAGGHNLTIILTREKDENLGLAAKTVQSHDPKAVDRGVKDQSLAALRDANLGTKARGCMVELEFIDVKAVDQLLNIGPNSPQVRHDIAKAIAEALVVAL